MVCLALRLRRERGAAAIAAWLKFWIVSIVYSSAACAELDGSTAAAPPTPVPVGLDLPVAGLVGSILLLMLLVAMVGSSAHNTGIPPSATDPQPSAQSPGCTTSPNTVH